MGQVRKFGVLVTKAIEKPLQRSQVTVTVLLPPPLLQGSFQQTAAIGGENSWLIQSAVLDNIQYYSKSTQKSQETKWRETVIAALG